MTPTPPPLTADERQEARKIAQQWLEFGPDFDDTLDEDDYKLARALLDAERDRTVLGEQIDRLAQFIMMNVPGEPSHSESAVETAIRLLGYVYLGADGRIATAPSSGDQRV